MGRYARRVRSYLRQRRTCRHVLIIWISIIAFSTFYLALKVVDIPSRGHDESPQDDGVKDVERIKSEAPVVASGSSCAVPVVIPSQVHMLDVYRHLKFENPDGGVWKQGWNVTYSKASVPKLRVFVVPHSHNDPGWKQTFEEYFRTQTKAIFDNAIRKLPEDSRRKFIWAEISYLSLWWDQAKPKEREIMKTLIKRGQIEIVTGGWVMPDEANSHYWTLIEQLITGHEWLKNAIGFEPVNGWSIDPFGLSSTYAFVLQKAGFENMLIQRVHYAIKKELALRKQLEFEWKQAWASRGITCHLMPFYSYDVPHTCGPDPKVCCQFDFKRLPGTGVTCPWRVSPVPITSENVESRAHVIMDQYRKKAELYASNVVLIPLGDDFRFVSPREWDDQYNNYQKLFDFINADTSLNAEVNFGTLSDYFNALRSEEAFEDLPSLTGDFFSYNDRNDNYWTGYYSSRPFYKHFDRLLTHYLRSAEVLYVAALTSGQVPGEESVLMHTQLDQARKALSLFQHHDGITGTAKDFVVDDYGKKMLEALANCERVMGTSLTRLTKKEIQHISMTEVMPEFNTVLRPVFVNEDVSIVVVCNPTLSNRKEIVSFYSERADVMVVNARMQISPNPSPMETGSHFIVYFEADVEPLSVKSYSLKFGVESKESFATVTVHDGGLESTQDWSRGLPTQFERRRASDDEFSIGFSDTLLFDSSGNLKKVLFADGTGMNVKVKSIQYGTRSHGEASGAYLFLPDGPAKDYVVRDPAPVVRIEGPLMMQVVVHTPLVRRVVSIMDSTGVSGLGISIKNFVDIHTVTDKELGMRIETDVESGTAFYTDSNGYQMIRRERFEKFGIQGNFYPMAASAYVEDISWRFTVLAQQPAGVSSQDSGALEIILDRRLSRDDDRGLGQGVMDTVFTEADFRILIERHDGMDDARVPALSMAANAASEALLHPLVKLLARIGPENLPEKSIGFRLLPGLSSGREKAETPCDLELTHLRAMGDGRGTPRSAGAVFRRRASACGIADGVEKKLRCLKQYDQDLTLEEVLGPDLAAHPEASTITFRKLESSIDDLTLDLSPMDLKAFLLKLPP